MSKTRELYVCTIFKDKPSVHTQYNLLMLDRGERLTVNPVMVQAGEFSHRHQVHEPDPVQILKRQVYIDEVPDGEWMLILDDDEVLLCPPDNMADFIDYLEVNDMDVGMIAEIRADGLAFGRPRLVKKREGMRYGGPRKKHDVIWYCDHDGMCDFGDDDEEPCLRGRNYIDVHDTERTMDLPIYFYHVKSSYQHVFTVPDGKDLQYPDWVIA